MNRREWLRLVLTGAAGLTLDVDKLLWVPGRKTIFLPPKWSLSNSQIIALEIERISEHIESLFDADDVFYKMIKSTTIRNISSREMRVPLTLRPGGLVLLPVKDE